MKNILLIEDNYEIIKLLKLHFQPEEFSLTACTTAGAALKKIKAENYHLIIYCE